MSIALALLASPAVAADQFDLICTSSTSKPVRYRVDVVRGEACSDACDRVWKMGQSTSGELKLINTVPNLPRDLEERLTVNRTTGEYHYTNTVPGLRPVFEEGRCEAAPFSGFPPAKF